MMNYCSICGSDKLVTKIPEGDHLPRIICTNCKEVHYINPKIIVGCVITDSEGKVMMARRGIEPRQNYWNLPAGFMELRETVDQGALREVFEETGARVSIKKMLTVYNVPHAGQVYVIFHADLENSTYHTTPESLEINFFAEENIPWDEVAFSSNEFALKTFFENRRTNMWDVKLGTYDKDTE